VVRFHREKLGPKISLLVVVGDADPAKVHAAAEKAFAKWTGGPDAPVTVPPLEKSASAGQVVIVDKPDATQTQVRIVAMGQKVGQPDHFPASVMNTILGGGFTSRLMDEIRVNRGLSYSVGSYFDRLRAAGTFGIGTFTKTESTGEIIEVALAQVKKLRTKGVTPKELKNAQTYVAGLFPLRTETNESIAGSILQMRLYGLGDDWISKFRERIFAVKPKELSAAATRYLFSEKPTIVVVGKASEIRKQVEKYGPVKVMQVSELE
jgi:zinc protease